MRRDAVPWTDKITVKKRLDKLETQSEINRMQFPMNKCKNLYMCRKIWFKEWVWRANGWIALQHQKDLQFLVNAKLDMGLQYQLLQKIMFEYINGSTACNMIQHRSFSSVIRELLILDPWGNYHFILQKVWEESRKEHQEQFDLQEKMDKLVTDLDKNGLRGEGWKTSRHKTERWIYSSS